MSTPTPSVIDVAALQAALDVAETRESATRRAAATLSQLAALQADVSQQSQHVVTASTVALGLRYLSSLLADLAQSDE